ncbi:MAG: DUF3179 domain-containing (seleno)protein [Pseudomonadota bacterium]
MKTNIIYSLILLSLLLTSAKVSAQETATPESFPQQIIQLFFTPYEKWDDAFKAVSDQWKPGYTPMAIEMLSLARGEIAYRFSDLLREKTGQNFGTDTNLWFVWWWQQDIAADKSYAEFKSGLFQHIDKKFGGYFSTERAARIRLDEVRWGGVKQDGIPPLRQPNMIKASEADYLGDDNVVFGVIINGDARAYPKRILAWHEMFIDEIGGTEYAGVYCTLCGAVILYETEFEGVRHKLGTSGFLYRSNKVMYDQDTQSLWNTTWGEPVIGPLVGKNIRLKRSYLVTTTWGEWKRRHPDTTVLSLETGHQRDYGEGVAYNAYFSNDALMFSISTSDERLKNKDEVLALTFPDKTDNTLAIAADFLSNNPVYHDSIDQLEFVVLTDQSGANRVYQLDGIKIKDYDQKGNVRDHQNRQWRVEEDGLYHDDTRLARLPAHRAFWFGWHAAFPDTRLVQ